MRILGSVFTVKVHSCDSLFIHKALDMADHGDVIVADGQGNATNSLPGEIMVHHAKQHHLADIVADGCVRDSSGICKLAGFPLL